MQRFFRTPKGLLTLVLAALAAAAATGEGVGDAVRILGAGIAPAMLIDAAILWRRNGSWEFPSGALLTGALVSMVLSTAEPWHVAALSAAIGVVTKYVARTRSANIFNPAALGLVVTFFIFGTAQDWWGALPNLPFFAIVLLLAGGIFITDRVNKTPLVLAFLGTYFLAFTVASFTGDPARVEEIFRPPDLHAVLFFAFFILTDPPTSPARYRPQLVCGILVALVSFLAFETIGSVYFLLAGVLVGNVWEAIRRARRSLTPAHAKR